MTDLRTTVRNALLADDRHLYLDWEDVDAMADAVLATLPDPPPPAPCFVEANGLGDTVLWFGAPGDPRPQHVLMQSDLDAYPGLWSWLTRGATVVPS